MMFNKYIPPNYLIFEDAEAWRICCENWGDYEEVVITDNGNNTVNITTTLKSMLNTTLKSSKIISIENNVDNSSGYYVAGTTKVPVGITKKQCENVTTIGTKFANNTTIKSFNELEYFIGVTTIVARAFANSTLEYLTLPNTITSIRDYGIYDMPNLVEIVIPSSVNTIGIDFCRACPNIERAIIYGNVTTLSRPFYNLRKLSLVVLPSSLQSITNTDTAKYTTGLKTIICKALTPPTLASSNLLYYGGNDELVYVPDESISLYSEADVWSYYSSKLRTFSQLREDDIDLYNKYIN